MSSMEGVPLGLAVPLAPAPVPFWLWRPVLRGPAGRASSLGLLGLADPLRPEVPSGSGAGRAWVTCLPSQAAPHSQVSRWQGWMVALGGVEVPAAPTHHHTAGFFVLFFLFGTRG